MQNERNQDTITAGELMDRQFFPRSVIVDGFLPAGTYTRGGICLPNNTACCFIEKTVSGSY